MVDRGPAASAPRAALKLILQLSGDLFSPISRSLL